MLINQWNMNIFNNKYIIVYLYASCLSYRVAQKECNTYDQ